MSRVALLGPTPGLVFDEPVSLSGYTDIRSPLSPLLVDAPVSRSDYTDIDKWPGLIDAMGKSLVDAAHPVHAARCLAHGSTDPMVARACSLRGVVTETDLTEFVSDVIDIAVALNQNSPNEVVTVILEGCSHIGKSIAGQKAILLLTKGVWGGSTPPAAGLGESRHHSIPCFYVEAGATVGPVSLLVEICRFGYIPADEKTRPGTLMRRLRENFRRMGTVVVVIDDAHCLTAAKDGKMANQLKHMITGLPVTFVFIGMDMSESALLSTQYDHGYQSSRQIEERRLRIPAEELAVYAKSDPAWPWSLQAVASQVHLVDGSEAANVFTSKTNCDAMHGVTGGKLGAATKLIRVAGQLALATPHWSFSQALTCASRLVS